MSKRNNFVFTILKIVAWIIFVSLSIEAGAMLVNFIFSVYKPEMVHNLYQKLDLSQMYQQSQWAYFSMYSLILVIMILKAFMFYLVIMLVTKLNLLKPFSSFTAEYITKISYFTLSIGLISFFASLTAENLMHRGIEIDALSQFWVDSEAYIFMAAIIYIIATIFSRGVELQNENDLTV